MWAATNRDISHASVFYNPSNGRAGEQEHKARLKNFGSNLLSVWRLGLILGLLGVAIGWVLCGMYGR
jgi:hypothetical protein